jgi:hypothetical protein
MIATLIFLLNPLASTTKADSWNVVVTLKTLYCCYSHNHSKHTDKVQIQTTQEDTLEIFRPPQLQCESDKHTT